MSSFWHRAYDGWCHLCTKRFKTDAGLQQHVAKQHFYRHAPGLSKDDLTCMIDNCRYAPAPDVLKPQQAFAAHQRKMHKMYKRPYIIREQP